MSGEFLLIPFVILALALIVFAVPYGFISTIKDLRVRWAIGGAYFSFLLSLFVVIDLSHFYELFTEFRHGDY